MDNKNLILAIVLSLLVMVGWTFLAEEMGLAPSREAMLQQQEQQAATAQNTQQTQNTEQAQGSDPLFETAPSLPRFTPAPGKDVVVDTPLYKAVFYSGGATLRSFALKKFPNNDQKKPWINIMGVSFGQVAPDGLNTTPVNLIPPKVAQVAPLGLLVNGQPSWSTGSWSFSGQDLNLKEGKATLQFTGEVDGLRLVRELTFYANTYQISEKIRINTLGDKTRSVRLSYTAAEDTTIASGSYYDSMRISWDIAGSYNEEADAETLAKEGLQVQGPISWAAATSTYFMSAIAPAKTDSLTLKSRVQDTVYRVLLEQGDVVVQPGVESHQDVTYWVGPKVGKLLKLAPNNLISAIDLGMFGLIGSGLLWCLQYLYDLAHNWGVAIILLTIGIKVIFWPFTAKSYESMAKMRKLQPMIQALREKHGDDRLALQQEMMALQKTYGVNPMGGCWPMLIQLPVFFGLYQALLSSIELRDASFITYLPGTDLVWLADLSQADPFFITPLLMGLTTFLMQKLTPAMGDPMQQKIMTIFLPLLLTVMALNFPSGLVIYWIVNNLLSMTQQWLLLKKSDKISLSKV